MSANIDLLDLPGSACLVHEVHEYRLTSHQRHQTVSYWVTLPDARLMQLNAEALEELHDWASATLQELLNRASLLLNGLPLVRSLKEEQLTPTNEFYVITLVLMANTHPSCPARNTLVHLTPERAVTHFIAEMWYTPGFIHQAYREGVFYRTSTRWRIAGRRADLDNSHSPIYGGRDTIVFD